MVHESTRSHEEAIKLVLGVKFLDGVKQSADDIVSTWRLTSTEDDANIHFLVVLHVTGNKLYERHAIGVWEESLDFLLIVHTLGRRSLHRLHGTLKSLWQFGLVGCPGLLQCAFFHNY